VGIRKHTQPPLVGKVLYLIVREPSCGSCTDRHDCQSRLAHRQKIRAVWGTSPALMITIPACSCSSGNHVSGARRPARFPRATSGCGRDRAEDRENCAPARYHHGPGDSVQLDVRWYRKVDASARR
jgi:hypothetical protein